MQLRDIGITKESKRPIKTFRGDPPEAEMDHNSGPLTPVASLSVRSTWVGGHSSRCLFTCLQVVR